MCWRKENKVLSFRQHYFCTFVTYNKIQMDINQNYREAVKSIKRSYPTQPVPCSRIGEQGTAISLLRHRAYVSENSRTGFLGEKGAIEQISSYCKKNCRG